MRRLLGWLALPWRALKLALAAYQEHERIARKLRAIAPRDRHGRRITPRPPPPSAPPTLAPAVRCPNCRAWLDAPPLSRLLTFLRACRDCGHVLGCDGLAVRSATDGEIDFFRATIGGQWREIEGRQRAWRERQATGVAPFVIPFAPTADGSKDF